MHAVETGSAQGVLGLAANGGDWKEPYAHWRAVADDVLARHLDYLVAGGNSSSRTGEKPKLEDKRDKDEEDCSTNDSRQQDPSFRAAARSTLAGRFRSLACAPRGSASASAASGEPSPPKKRRRASGKTLTAFMLASSYTKTEVEVRFGSFDQQGNFVFEIGWAHFQKILDTFCASSTWTASVREHLQVKYYYRYDDHDYCTVVCYPGSSDSSEPVRADQAGSSCFTRDAANANSYVLQKFLSSPDECSSSTKRLGTGSEETMHIGHLRKEVHARTDFRWQNKNRPASPTGVGQLKFRIATSTETHVVGPNTPSSFVQATDTSLVRVMLCWSFYCGKGQHARLWKYDLKLVWEGRSRSEAEQRISTNQTPKCQVEIELEDPDGYLLQPFRSLSYLSYSLLLKVYDVLKIIDPSLSVHDGEFVLS